MGRWSSIFFFLSFFSVTQWHTESREWVKKKPFLLLLPRKDAREAEPLESRDSFEWKPIGSLYLSLSFSSSLLSVSNVMQWIQEDAAGVERVKDFPSSQKQKTERRETRRRRKGRRKSNTGRRRIRRRRRSCALMLRIRTQNTEHTHRAAKSK